MSGKPKRAWSSDKFSGSGDPPARKAAVTGREQAAAGHGPHRDAEDVETLVGDFLKELDVLAIELRRGPAGRSERQPKVVAAPVVARDPGLVEASPPHAEIESPREKEQGQEPEIDAELARTLDELEMQEKSNVIVLPSAATRAAAAGPEPAAPPESNAGPAPEAQSPAAAGEIAGTAPQPQRVLFSSAGLSKPGRGIWKPVIRAAAAVFLAGAAFAVYRLLPLAPNPVQPSSPPAGTSAAKPQITPPPTIVSHQTGEDAEITQAPEYMAPTPVASAAKPSKTPASRPAEVDRTSARPAEKPAPKKESVPPGPAASQPVTAAPAQASQQLAITPEPPPAALQAAPPPPPEVKDAASESRPDRGGGAGSQVSLPEAKVATAERATPPSGGVIPAEPQVTSAAKPAPQAVPLSQPAAQEAARPGAVLARPENATAKTPVAAAAGEAVRATPPAAQPAAGPPVSSYTPPVAIDKPVPVYPPLARNTKTTGTVEVEVEVDEQGKVLKAAAVSGPSLLRAAAEDALRRWRFKPAVRNGVNVRSLVRISVVFRE